MVELTAEQRRELRRDPKVRFVDPDTGAEYVAIPAAQEAIFLQALRDRRPEEDEQDRRELEGWMQLVNQARAEMLREEQW